MSKTYKANKIEDDHDYTIHQFAKMYDMTYPTAIKFLKDANIPIVRMGKTNWFRGIYFNQYMDTGVLKI